MDLLRGIAFLCLGVCVYVYAGYPCLLALLARLRPRPLRKASLYPSVSVIIAAHNEDAVIEAKLRNTLDLNYPGGLELLVACDGCTDATVARARRFAGDGVRVLDLPRCGKARALNAASRHARGELLVMTDANSMLALDSLKYLVEGFADPQVGGVCGNLEHRQFGSRGATGHGESLYWRYDKWIKSLESRCGSIVAADGSLYALRRELFVPIAEPTLADDVAISARVVLQGYRLVFEPRALAYEDAPRRSGDEFWRKIRVTNHSMRALLDLGAALWMSGFYSLELWSHKLLRHLIPFFLIVFATVSVWLARSSPWFRLAVALQLGFYGAAALCSAGPGTPLRRWRVLGLPFYFCLANAAALVGICSLLAGRRTAAWTPRRGLARSRGE